MTSFRLNFNVDLSLLEFKFQDLLLQFFHLFHSLINSVMEHLWSWRDPLGVRIFISLQLCLRYVILCDLFSESQQIYIVLKGFLSDLKCVICLIDVNQLLNIFLFLAHELFHEIFEVIIDRVLLLPIRLWHLSFDNRQILIFFYLRKLNIFFLRFYNSFRVTFRYILLHCFLDELHLVPGFRSFW